METKTVPAPEQERQRPKSTTTAKCLALLVEASGDCFPIDLTAPSFTPLDLFGRRRYEDTYQARPPRGQPTHPKHAKERNGDIVLNRSALIHDPAQHDNVGGERNCITAWTVTCGERGQGDNPIGMVIVAGLPCFAPGAQSKCKGRMVFVGWNGRALTQTELDTMMTLARLAELNKVSVPSASLEEGRKEA